jgi:hypothetical protein
MTQVFLESHPPKRRQFYKQRHDEPTGAICLHTGENKPTLKLPETSAESLASFIANRTDSPGSYHSACDRDSTVHIGHYGWEMFGEGTGGNAWALHLSFACQAAKWETYPKEWVDGALNQAVAESIRMAKWLKANKHNIPQPIKITKSQYFQGHSGFVLHRELDPARRSDPGDYFVNHLYDRFIEQYKQALIAEGLIPGMPKPKPFELPPEQKEYLANIQLVLKNEGFYNGPIHAQADLAVRDAVHALKNDRAKIIAALGEAQAHISQLETDLEAAHARIGQMQEANRLMTEVFPEPEPTGEHAFTLPDPRDDMGWAPVDPLPITGEQPVVQPPQEPEEEITTVDTGAPSEAVPRPVQPAEGNLDQTVLAGLARIYHLSYRIRTSLNDLEDWSNQIGDEAKALHRIIQE